MPTYVYACKSCGHRFEKYQSFSEDSLVTCPECMQDALRKVFDSVGIVFKGPGFYSTDSATSARSTGSGSTGTEKSGEKGGEASPAAAGTTASTESSSSSSGTSSGSSSADTPAAAAAS